jgi:hypothetical protein
MPLLSDLPMLYVERILFVLGFCFFFKGDLGDKPGDTGAEGFNTPFIYLFWKDLKY